MDLDIEDELLALADDTHSSSKKRSSKSSSSKASKRRKPMDDSDDEEEAMDIDSGSDDDGGEGASSSNPYPLEGLYKNEADRSRIMKMSELDREQALAERTAEREKLDESNKLDAFYQQARATGDDIQGPAQSSKRAHQMTGVTSTKKTKLAELSKKRSEKQSRQSGKSSSAGRRRESDGSSSEGESSVSEDDAEKRARKKAREAITLEDLERVRLSRSTLARMCKTPHFDELVVGSYVRYSLGTDSAKRPVYRICEIVGVEELKKLYEMDIDSGTKDYRRLLLKVGSSERAYYMSQISNSPFTPAEWNFWYSSMRSEGVTIPSKKQLQAKRDSWTEISKRKITDAELSEMLRKKKEKDPEERLQSLKHDLTRRRAEHTMAIKRQDPDAAELLVAQIRTIEADISLLSSPYAGSNASGGAAGGRGAEGDLLQKLNEKNRKAQLDAIKKNDQELREKRRLAAKASANGEILLGEKAKAKLLGISNSQNGFGTPTGSGAVSPVPSVSEPLGIFSLGEPRQRFRPEVAVIADLVLNLGDF